VLLLIELEELLIELELEELELLGAPV